MRRQNPLVPELQCQYIFTHEAFRNYLCKCLSQALRSVAVRFLATVNAERKVIREIVNIAVYFHTSVQVIRLTLCLTPQDIQRTCCPFCPFALFGTLRTFKGIHSFTHAEVWMEKREGTLVFTALDCTCCRSTSGIWMPWFLMLLAFCLVVLLSIAICLGFNGLQKHLDEMGSARRSSVMAR